MRWNHTLALAVALFSVALYCAPTAHAAPPDPCSLLTQAQVSAVFGVNVEPAQRIAPKLCQWSAPNQPGIGDDAVYSSVPGVTPGLGTTLTVKKGDSYFAVHLYGFPGEAKAMAMEKVLALEIISRL